MVMVVGWLLSLSKLVCLAFISGPNNLNLFQPVDPASSTQPALNDLSLKLVFFYNSKVSMLNTWILLGFTIMPSVLLEAYIRYTSVRSNES